MPCRRISRRTLCAARARFSLFQGIAARPPTWPRMRGRAAPRQPLRYFAGLLSGHFSLTPRLISSRALSLETARPRPLLRICMIAEGPANGHVDGRFSGWLSRCPGRAPPPPHFVRASLARHRFTPLICFRRGDEYDAHYIFRRYLGTTSRPFICLSVIIAVMPGPTRLPLTCRRSTSRASSLPPLHFY